MRNLFHYGTGQIFPREMKYFIERSELSTKRMIKSQKMIYTKHKRILYSDENTRSVKCFEKTLAIKV